MSRSPARGFSLVELMIASTIFTTIARMFSGSGRARDLAAASHESASIMIAASLN